MHFSICCQHQPGLPGTAHKDRSTALVSAEGRPETNCPPLVSLLIQTLCSTIDPVLRGDWPVWGWARRFHHTLSWQSLSSRSWPRHWAWCRSWRSCRGTALSVRSLASRTHMGSHLHELRLPTAVPNKQQTNGVALKLISTYHGTDAEHQLIWLCAHTG